jgi:hypothetical protein
MQKSQNLYLYRKLSRISKNLEGCGSRLSEGTTPALSWNVEENQEQSESGQPVAIQRCELGASPLH